MAEKEVKEAVETEEKVTASLVKALIEQAVDDKITQATTSNADLVSGLVEQIMSLKVKEAKNETKKQEALQKALIEAKKEFKPLKANRIAKYEHKGKTRFHHYSTLSAIKEATDKALQKHGLIVQFDIENKFGSRGAGMVVKAILLHKDGGRLESSSMAQEINLTAVQGSATDQTYLKRYALCNLLGIESEEDNDPDFQEDKTQSNQGATQQDGLVDELNQLSNSNQSKPKEEQSDEQVEEVDPNEPMI